MEEKKILLQSTTKPDNKKPALKFGDEWHEVKGNAQKYIKNLQIRNEYTVKLDDEGKVVFVGSSKPGETHSPKFRQQSDRVEERIMKTGSFNNAVRLVARTELKGLTKEEVLKRIEEYAKLIYVSEKKFIETEITSDGVSIDMEEEK